MVFFMNEGAMPSPVPTHSVVPRLARQGDGEPQRPHYASTFGHASVDAHRRGPSPDAHHAGRTRGHGRLEVVRSVPIERSPRPSPSARWATVSKDARATAAGPGAATVMEAHHVEVEGTQAPHQVGHLMGRTAVPAGQARRVDLRHDRRPGGEAGDPLPLADPGHALPEADDGRQARHLVALHGAEEVPDRVTGCAARWVADQAGLPRELRRVVLADVAQSRAEGCPHCVRSEAFGDADDPDALGITAGALDAQPECLEPGSDLGASAGRRGRRNRRRRGRALLPFPWRRRRCPPARACRRSRRPGRRPWAERLLPSVRIRRR